MPEGDTVWLTAQRLNRALAGERLVQTDFRVPALATTNLAGRRTREVRSVGKHLLMRFDGGVTVHSHLGMPGSWRVHRRGSPWRGGPGWEVRAVLRTGRLDAVGYRLRVLELIRTDAESGVVGHLGPDLLSEGWGPESEAEAVRRLGGDPSRPIGPALLDQRNLAGIGNLYKTEVLYLTGVTPWTPVSEVPDLQRTVVMARELLVSNRDRWEQSTTGALSRPEAHWVFERTGRPCRRCGTVVRQARDTPSHERRGQRIERALDRVNYWCPQCQRGPAPQPGGPA